MKTENSRTRKMVGERKRMSFEMNQIYFIVYVILCRIENTLNHSNRIFLYLAFYLYILYYLFFHNFFDWLLYVFVFLYCCVSSVQFPIFFVLLHSIQLPFYTQIYRLFQIEFLFLNTNIVFL